MYAPRALAPRALAPHAPTPKSHPQVPPTSPTPKSHPQVPPTSPTPQEPPRPSFTNEFIMSSPEIYSDDVFDDVTSDAYKPPMTSNSVASVAGFLHEQAKAQEWTLEQQRREIAMLRQDEIALKERNNTLNAENKHLREENKKFRTNEQRSYNNDKSKWLSKSKPAGFGNEKRSADTERFIVKCIVPRIRNYKDAQAVLLYLNTRMATKRNSQAKPSTPATPIRLSRDHPLRAVSRLSRPSQHVRCQHACHCQEADQDDQDDQADQDDQDDQATTRAYPTAQEKTN